MSLRSQALSGLRWTVSVKLMSQMITWVITLVVIRLLTPTDYGLLAMATVFVSFLAMFSQLGLGAAVIQKADMDEMLLKRVFGIILIVHFFIAALLILLAPIIGSFYNEPRVIPIIQVLAFQFVFAAFAVIPDAQLQRRMEFRYRSLLDFTGAIAAGVTTLAMAFAGAGVWALVIGFIFSQIVKTIGTNWLSPFWSRPEFSVKGMAPLLKFGGNFTAVQVFWMFLSQIDTLICAKLLGKEILGLYSVAMQIASLPSDRISGLVNQVAFPTFSRMQHDLKKVKANVLAGVRVLSFIGFPILWGISSVAPEIVDVVLGAKWVASTLPLQLLSLIIPLRMIGNFVATAMQGTGRSDIVLRNVVWASLISPLAFLAGTYWWGLLGLSIAWLVASPIVFLQAMMRNMPALDLRMRELAGAMLPPAGAAFVMYGAVTWTRHMFVGGQAGVIRLSVLVGVGALLYGLASLWLNRNGVREALDLGRNIITSTHQ